MSEPSGLEPAPIEAMRDLLQAHTGPQSDLSYARRDAWNA